MGSSPGGTRIPTNMILKPGSTRAKRANQKWPLRMATQAMSYSEMLQRTTTLPPRTDPTLQDPHCVYQILRRHYASLYARDGRARHRLPAGNLPPDRRSHHAQLGPRADDGLVLRGGLDAPYHRGADHPRRYDHPGLAGQHRPPWRRHSGAARALRASRAAPTYPPCTTCCPATCPNPTFTRTSKRSAITSPAQTSPTGWLAQLSQIHRQPAARLVRRACRAGERVGLPMAPKDHRRSTRSCR